mmetsp:Transcript_35884/g.78398  ORF Transcript_35884/g.78398 Transcript_35884/m.78398 type:complete len:161 (-) Transcript_35884:248-730(-)
MRGTHPQTSSMLPRPPTLRQQRTCLDMGTDPIRGQHGRMPRWIGHSLLRDLLVTAQGDPSLVRGGQEGAVSFQSMAEAVLSKALTMSSGTYRGVRAKQEAMTGELGISMILFLSGFSLRRLAIRRHSRSNSSRSHRSRSRSLSRSRNKRRCRVMWKGSNS